MKYSEFKREIEKLGFQIYDRSYDNIIVSFSDRTIGSVSKLRNNEGRVGNGGLQALDEDLKKEVFMLCFELASTPIEEREDEKRYRLRMPFIKNGMGYLNEFQGNDIFIGDKHQVYKYKTIFTESEIAELKAKHNLDSFVLEEVKEDE